MPPLRRLSLKAELEPRLAEAQADQRTVLFADAAHFVLVRSWAGYGVLSVCSFAELQVANDTTSLVR